MKFRKSLLEVTAAQLAEGKISEDDARLIRRVSFLRLDVLAATHAMVCECCDLPDNGAGLSQGEWITQLAALFQLILDFIKALMNLT